MTLRNAATLFAVGWALFWASALGLVTFVPLWFALALLVCALGMIPLASRQAKPRAVAASQAPIMPAATEP